MSRKLQDYNPEDTKFWEEKGSAIANRNLWISIPNLTLAFIVWYIFSAVVINLNKVGYNLTPEQIFNLVALPGLFGATLRIFYGFLNPVFGGRNFTTFATLTLIIPAAGIGYIAQNPDTPYWVLVILSLLSGFGCANFSSSNANIPGFFPKHKQGGALGLNAGFGNLGVSIVQFTTPLLIGTGIFVFIFGEGQITATGKTLYLQNAAFFWIIPLIIFALLAWFKMDNLVNKDTPKFQEQLFIFKRKHTYSIMILYLMTFGGFAGFAASFPMILSQKFPDFNALSVAFIGPLVGALIRPVGGWLSDKIGGSIITLFVFVGVAVCIYVITLVDSLLPFVIMFVLLFACCGVGNGSTFGMIAEVFTPKEKGAAVGFIAAIGAYGAFFIPKIFGMAGITKGLWIIFAFNLLCLLITYFGYCFKRKVRN
ncbi:MAG: MFS transporter [Alphaproteobacteria bacterium]|jgi:NNP family nitrate/nitrite transporter-like MFS transporter|nr:MFS transporter [Alphaproteobacteria bacterium]